MSKLQSASLEMHKSRQGRLTPCANGQPFRDLLCCGRSFPTLKHCAYRMSGTKAWPAFSGLLLHQMALASLHRCGILVTWNCRHLANANKTDHIRRVNALVGLETPLLVTPLELLDSEDENEA